MKVLFWIIVPLLFLIAIVFAVRNHAMVDVSLWPILLDPVSLPTYAIALVALFIGFLWGGFVAWMQGSAGRARRRALAQPVGGRTSRADRYPREAGKAGKR